MTSNDTQAAAPTVLLRSEGEVDEETLSYARTKIDAVVGRPGLPAATGEVRITRVAAHHADRPWTATAALHVGRREVVVLAEEATGREAVDQLQDRLRRQIDKAAHAGHNRPPDGGPAVARRPRNPASCRRKQPDGGLSPGVSPRSVQARSVTVHRPGLCASPLAQRR
ncbi:hypothetical protein RKD27_003142 [Streptomyces sp. SAI-126]|uniref:hypothetical protein n=1 Tax=Streptomyces sp. SAI-126 TaxID=3377732 RepID=UPI003C7D760D